MTPRQRLYNATRRERLYNVTRRQRLYNATRRLSASTQKGHVGRCSGGGQTRACPPRLYLLPTFESCPFWRAHDSEADQVALMVRFSPHDLPEELLPTPPRSSASTTLTAGHALTEKSGRGEIKLLFLVNGYVGNTLTCQYVVTGRAGGPTYWLLAQAL